MDIVDLARQQRRCARAQRTRNEQRRASRSAHCRYAESKAHFFDNFSIIKLQDVQKVSAVRESKPMEVSATPLIKIPRGHTLFFSYPIVSSIQL